MSYDTPFPGGMIEISFRLRELRMAMVERFADFSESFKEQAAVAVDQAIENLDLERELLSIAQGEVMQRLNDCVREIANGAAFASKIEGMARAVIESSDFEARIKQQVVSEVAKVAERLAQNVLYQSDVRHQLADSIEEMLLHGLTDRVERRKGGE